MKTPMYVLSIKTFKMVNATPRCASTCSDKLERLGEQFLEDALQEADVPRKYYDDDMYEGGDLSADLYYTIDLVDLIPA